MNQVISQEKAQKLSIIEGKTRGIAMKPDVQFILRKKGKEGLKEVEGKMEELGTPMDLDNIKTGDMYPIGIRTIFLLAAKEVLDFSNEDIKEMGEEVPKYSSIIRFFMRSFMMDQEKFFQKAPVFWERFVTIGRVSVPFFDEKEKKAVVRLEGFNVDPVFCPYVEGVFSSFVKIITGNKQVKSQESHCFFHGGDYHEFTLEW